MNEVFILYLIIFDENTNTYYNQIYGVYSTKALAQSFEAVARAENSDDVSVVDYKIAHWSVI